MKISRILRLLFAVSLSLPLSGLAQNSNQTVFQELFAFDFGGIQDWTYQRQMDLLIEVGFDGVIIGDNPPERISVKNLEDWYNVIDKSTKPFKISAMYYRHHFDNGKWPDDSAWKPIMAKLAEKKIPFMVIVKDLTNNSVNFQSVENEFKKMVAYGNTLDLPVVIYPHSKNYIESVADALPYVQSINDPNFTMSLHLCHELRAGYANSMVEVINTNAQYISLVTFNGADSKDIRKIIPLYQGDYDTEYFLSTLAAAGYKGPVGLHTHSISGIPPKEHLAGSFNLIMERISKIEPASVYLKTEPIDNPGIFFLNQMGVLSISNKDLYKLNGRKVQIN